ncbi:hypothetical protein IMX26_13085 [Clostridium sp. 'deep sea']|uniref:hypothetical protein n=1 Tax=Clostridium sp. 'deep sea' TaxID=2779445 RepID=UPI00189687E0|nr:hypothetical protein [Clostridium sp. 'deep sea']QOR34420.1 hypothetical protein IMX26_13085 [Clostridium sp. 'deep sea']
MGGQTQMLEINININASELAQAITLLATNLGQAKSVNVVKSNSPKVELAEKAISSMSEMMNQVIENVEPTKEEKEQTTTEPTLTVVEVRALVKKAAKKDKAAVKSLLKEFGAESVTALDEEHYQAFYDKVEELL